MTDFPPLRDELRGLTPYGAPQLDVPVQLNVNENPYGPSPECVADIAASVAEAAGTLNRYPDREFTELRTALAAYLSKDTPDTAIAPEQVWAANGSNEVMLQLLQAYAGPGRTALASRRRTRCIRSTPATPTPSGWSATARRTSRSTSTTPARSSSGTGRPWCCCRAPTTRPAPRCPTTRSPACARRPATGWW